VDYKASKHIYSVVSSNPINLA